MAATAMKKMPVKAGPASVLSQKAMLVKITVHRWRVWVADDKATKETTDAHQAVSDVGQFRKKLLEYSTKADITTAINSMTRVRDKYTLPWEDGGWRLVSAAGYFKLVSKINEGRSKIMFAVEDFLKEYPKHIQNEKIRQGTLFDETLYPTANEIRSKYRLSVWFSPVPSGDDIRLNIGDLELAQVRQQANEAAEETLKQAVATIWARYADVVGRMVERLNAYTVDAAGKASNTFKDSLVTNIKELLEVVPTINITGDPKITAFAARIQKDLAVHTPDELRSSPVIRKQVAAQAQDILDKMKAYLT